MIDTYNPSGHGVRVIDCETRKRQVIAPGLDAASRAPSDQAMDLVAFRGECPSRYPVIGRGDRMNSLRLNDKELEHCTNRKRYILTIPVVLGFLSAK